jgi:branched-chain amino acid transport system permease protein
MGRVRAVTGSWSVHGSATGAYAPIALIGAGLAAVPVLDGGSPYLRSLAVSMLVLACHAIAFNIAFGLTGQLLLCLGALAGVSAYASVVLADDLGWPIWVTIPAGTVLASALGALFSWVAARRELDTIFVGIVTLAFSLVFTNAVQGLRTLTGGETGRLVGAGSGSLLREPGLSYAVFVAATLAFLVLFRVIQRSRLGWGFRALRDDEVAAELAGVDVVRHRVIAGALAAAMLGATGALFVHHDGFVSPSVFAFAHVDVRVLVALALGGIGSLAGPVVGAVAVGVLDELLRPLGQLRLAVYGGVLLALFLGLGRGFAGGPGVPRWTRDPEG